MNNPTTPILSLLLAVPLAGALLLLLIQGQRGGLLKGIALAAAGVNLALSVPLFFLFQPGVAGAQFVELQAWIPALGASYHVGVDGLSLLLVLLTTLLTPLAILGSWHAVSKHLKGFLIAMLVLESGIIGVFVSLDLLLFYLFWEITLVPVFLLIGIWGSERRIYATVKFFLYAMAGSVFMLVAILALYSMNAEATGTATFDLAMLAQYARTLPRGAQFWLFMAFFVAFAVKVPLFPFHTWLPDAYTEAPAAVTVLLAGVLKIGAYGLLRFAFPMFPQVVQGLAPYVSVLAIIGILYGALVALAQPDLKRLVAYSSVAHLGFVTLGIFALTPQGLAGGMLQLVNTGLSTAALFLLVGMLYERRRTRQISEFGGLWRVLPVFSALFMLVTLSSIGLPGTNGFVGEFLILLGAFRGYALWGVLGAAGIILAAVYMLWTYQRVFFGTVDRPANCLLKDLNVREIVTMAPLAVMILLIGWFPGPFLARLEPAVQQILALFH